MKTLKRITTATMLGVILFSSCKKEELVNLSEDASSAKSLVASPCETSCIDENSADAFAESTSNTVSWGGPNSDKFSKSGTARVWNTATEIVYEFTSEVAISDLILNGLSTGLTAPANTPLSYTIALNAGWNACDSIANNFALAGSGPQIVFSNLSYNLIGICPTGCLDDLQVDLVCGSPNTLNVTFTASEAGPIVIQGGLTAKTTVISASSNLLTLITSHPSAGGPSNVTRWEGNVEACQQVTITIEFDGGNGIGSWSASGGGIELGRTPSQTCN